LSNWVYEFIKNWEFQSIGYLRRLCIHLHQRLLFCMKDCCILLNACSSAYSPLLLMKSNHLCLESLFLLFSYLVCWFLLIGLVGIGKRRKLLWILKSLVSCLLLNYSLLIFFNSFSWCGMSFNLPKFKNESCEFTRLEKERENFDLFGCK